MQNDPPTEAACIEQFETTDGLQADVNEWFDTLAADFFNTLVSNLVPQYKKCVEVTGVCVER